MGKSRPSSDTWRDSSAQPNLQAQQPPNQSGLQSLKEDDDNSLKPIDLSRYLSQNSARISNTGSNDRSNNNNNNNEDSFKVDGSRNVLENYKKGPTSRPRSEVNGKDLSDFNTTDKNFAHHDEVLENYVFTGVSREPEVETKRSTVQEGLTNQRSGIRDSVSSISERHLDQKNESEVSSILDQVKAKLRSRSESLAAQDKIKISPQSYVNSLPVVAPPQEATSDRTSPVPHSRVSFPGTNLAPERRGSGRYREIREHILGGSVSTSDGKDISEQPLILQREPEQQHEPHHPQHTEQKDQLSKNHGIKKRQSRIPIPTWRRSKSVSKLRRSSQDYCDNLDSSVGNGHIPSSLAAKLSEFRNDLDKEEELLKHVTERRSSNLSSGVKDLPPTESPLVKFVVVGTTKAQEWEESQTSIDSSDESNFVCSKDFLTDLNAETPQSQVELESKLSSSIDADDEEDLYHVAPPPLEFRDESCFHPGATSSTTDLPISDSSENSLESAPKISTETFSTEELVVDNTGTLSLPLPEEGNDLVRQNEEENNDEVDTCLPHKKSSAIKRSRPVRKSATVSYSTRDVNQLDRIEETQESGSPKPVPRKRKSGFLVPRDTEQRVEYNTAESLEQVVVPPPSGFSDTLAPDKAVGDSTDSTTEYGDLGAPGSGTENLVGKADSEESKPTFNETDEELYNFEENETESAVRRESEVPEKTPPTTSSDSSEFWKRLIADPIETPKTSGPSGRRPLRSSVPVFGNYPKSSHTNASAGAEDSPTSASVKRRHSDVSNRPNMEQLFSSLLDDLEKESQSESNPSDVELSDSDDLLANSSGSNSSGKTSDILPISTTIMTEEVIPTSDNTTVSEKLPHDISSVNVKLWDPKDNTPETDVDLDLKSESNNSNDGVHEDEIVVTRRFQRNSSFHMPDAVDGKHMYSKEDIGIDLGVVETLPAKDVKVSLKTSYSNP